MCRGSSSLAGVLYGPKCAAVPLRPFQQYDLPQAFRRPLGRLDEIPQHGQIGGHFVEEIISWLQGRVKDVRHVARFTDDAINIGSVQQVDRNISSRRLEFGLPPREANHLPIGQRDKMLHQRPPADAKGAGDQRFFSPGLRLDHRLWAPFVRGLRIVWASGRTRIVLARLANPHPKTLFRHGVARRGNLCEARSTDRLVKRQTGPARSSTRNGMREER